MRRDVLAYDVDRPVGAFQLEIPVVGAEPSIHDLDDLDRAIIEVETPGRFVATVARIAFHGDLHGGACSGLAHDLDCSMVQQ